MHTVLYNIILMLVGTGHCHRFNTKHWSLAAAPGSSRAAAPALLLLLLLHTAHKTSTNVMQEDQSRETAGPGDT